IDGRTDEISEQQIGVQVFKRTPGYNPNDDSIVRSHARLLRQRLDAYFEEDGKNEELRVHIPKGRYIPLFEQREAQSVQLPAAALPVVTEKKASRRWIWFCSAGCAAALALSVFWVRSESANRSAAQLF